MSPGSCVSPFVSPVASGPDLTYSFTILGPVNALTITVTGIGGYDPSIYVLSTCDDGTTCVGYSGQLFRKPPRGDQPHQFSPGHLSPVPRLFHSRPGAGSQGTYTLSVTGNLGVAPTATPISPRPIRRRPRRRRFSPATNTRTVTPTPIFTATNTPTASPTLTSTPVPPTLTPTPAGQGGPGAGPATPIPTLSGWMLAAFAAALVAVALFLTRRS